jgi:molecular chaperone DnaK (HSP70)
MILLIDENKDIRKKLCDLISRERIIQVDSYPRSLEMMCKFKNRFDIIIANIHSLQDILSRQTLFKLCHKLNIKTPPILGFYKKCDEQIKKEFEKNNKHYRLIEYNKEDQEFPERYIQAIKELYPELVADINKAKELWSKEEQTEELVDPRKWLEEEGFLDIDVTKNAQNSEKDIKELTASIEEILKDKEEEEIEKKGKKLNYKKMYFEIKERHNEVLRQVQELK